ncbi:MAG: S1 RNA-binding domain-containing protein, partial [Bacteroidales bacterium]|nr:S1 RNA-binding domain-containing protein [Bacteroidales bacterium]
MEAAAVEEAPVEAPVEETAPVVEEAPAVEEAPKAKKVAKAEEVKPARLNASIDPKDFDWEAFEQGGVYATEDKTAVEDAYNATLNKVVENEVVEGEVTEINKREVIVSIGGKSEGVISAADFRYNPDLKVGDKVEVFVESAEDKKGQLVLSHKKARALKSWDRVSEAFEKDEIVKGYVKTRTKGGMIVDV